MEKAIKYRTMGAFVKKGEKKTEKNKYKLKLELDFG